MNFPRLGLTPPLIGTGAVRFVPLTSDRTAFSLHVNK